MIDVSPSAFMVVPFLLMVAFYGFILYVVICVLRFMKEKIRLDEERNQLLAELVKWTRSKHTGSE